MICTSNDSENRLYDFSGEVSLVCAYWEDEEGNWRAPYTISNPQSTRVGEVAARVRRNLKHVTMHSNSVPVAGSWCVHVNNNTETQSAFPVINIIIISTIQIS